MPTEIKTCISCGHCVPYPNRLDLSKCRCPSTLKYDPSVLVTGESNIANQMRYCENNRLGACGEEAKFWIPLPPPLPLWKRILNFP